MRRKTRPQAWCIRCYKVPKELPEYSPLMTGTDLSHDEYVWKHEKSLNRRNGHFFCTGCYVDVGMPIRPKGWVAP